MDVNNKPKISVITATYNAVEHLPTLIKSLREQTDQDFEWVVADGGSTDGTLKLLQQISDLNIKITSQPDFGIYDALNRAIKLSTGDYYVVAGADDWFFSNAISDYRQAITTNADVITANIKQNNRIFKPLNKAPWLYGMQCYVSNHSIGTLFKKSIHERFGYYSNKFPIAADNFFILSAMQHTTTVLKQIPAVVGEFSVGGLSSADLVGSLTENFRIQIKIGNNKCLQLGILFLRLLKYFFRY